MDQPRKRKIKKVSSCTSFTKAKKRPLSARACRIFSLKELAPQISVSVSLRVRNSAGRRDHKIAHYGVLVTWK